MDLIVEEATIDPSASREQIIVRVRNQGTRTIVAWGVNAILTDANGVVGHAGGGIDGYEYDMRVLHDDPVLRPNGTYTIQLTPSRRGFEPVSVTASPEYAIFDDNSAVGDERSIEMRFERRAREAAGWQFIERAIAEALANATAADGVLRLLNAELAAAPREMRDSSSWSQVSSRIRVALRPGSPETTREHLQAWTVEAHTFGTAAASRSIRRR